MKWLSFTTVLCLLFIIYIAHSVWVIYSLFSPTQCDKKMRKSSCLEPFHANALQLHVYTSRYENVNLERHLKLVWNNSNFSLTESTTKDVNVTIPLSTRNNGSLFVHVLLFPKHRGPRNSPYISHAHSLLTTYAIPQSQYFSLLGQEEKVAQANTTDAEHTQTTTQGGRTQTTTHWHSRMIINVMASDIAFDRSAVPQELFTYLRVVDGHYYLPIIYIDELSNRIRHLKQVKESSTEMPLHISYSPTSVGKLRLWIQMQQSLQVLQSLGFTEKDVDEVKGIFADTNMYFLLMTFCVAAIHLLFDVLAFKNDVSYWRNRDTMIGLSSRAVVWRCVSTIIIFLYLMDEQTSMLVLVPAGVGSIIEVWKVTKAFKVSVSWSGWRPRIQLGKSSEKEQETQQYDSQAMSYLSMLLYPLCIAGAVYSLLYVQHKSWVSWTIQSLVNGVYAFGFLFMLPQLFVNYKLKSVAHLPWRAFMYKAFNTFIDDIFAFIITMPTSHRLACFRDDLVFLVYLYQRWLYPVDKTRVNEYGMSFDADGKVGKNKKLKNKKTD